MDADLNHHPEQIPVLIEAARQSGAGIVVGSRRVADSSVKGVPIWKTLTSGVVGAIMNYTLDIKIKDMTSGFRVYRASVLRRIQFRNHDFAFLPEILVEATAMGETIIERPIQFTYREAGVSKMAIWKTSLSYFRLFRSYLSGRRTGAMPAQPQREATTRNRLSCSVSPTKE